MSNTTFAAMVPDVAAFLQGCPNATVELTLRKVVTDLCQRGRVWVGDATPIALVPGVATYTPVSPVQHSEYADFLSGYVVIAGRRTDLAWERAELVRRAYPEWPINAPGSPQQATADAPGTLQLAPVPDAAGTLFVRAYLRPARDALAWSTALYSEFHRAVFHGVLTELMGMPDRAWSAPQLALVHGRMWTNLVREARDRSMRGFGTAEIAVEMRPFV